MNKSLLLASVSAVTLLASPALAQTAGQIDPTTQNSPTAKSGKVANTATADTPIDTGDIVVTATRRNEALSDVPLAVSAVTAQSLENSGATDIRQLTQLSPSLLVSSTSSEAGGGAARIRGVGTVGDNPGLESSVAVFIDGVYRSRTGVGLTELGAIDRIEVLRGPQGTLFGRNASAGLISIITAKPKFQLGASAQADVGNYNYRRLELGVTGPLSSTLAARIDGVYMKRDGFLKDVVSGRDVNDRDRYLVRGQLLFEPSTDLSVRLIADYAKRKEECCAAVYFPVRDYTATGPKPSTVAGFENALGARIQDNAKARRVSITPGRDYASNVEDYGLSGEINYKLGGGVQMTSITAYRSNEYIRGQDTDFNALDLLYRKSDGGSANRFRTFTQEVRFQGSTLGDKLDWLIGGYYSNEKLRVKDNLAYGKDYEAFSNCLVATKIQTLTGVPLVSPTAANGSCFNRQVAIAAQSITAIPAPTRGVIALFAGLVPGLPQGGFDAVSARIGQPLLQIGQNGINDTYNQTSNNYAIFTHNIFSITDKLKLTVGLRYTHEKKTLDASLRDTNPGNNFCGILNATPLAALVTLPCVLPTVPGGALNDSASKTESKISGTAVLSYKLSPELLTYASFSRGYKAGGFNLDRSALPRSSNGSITDPNSGPVCGSAAQAGCTTSLRTGPARIGELAFAPEINNAFELGVKYNGRGIDINIAAFHQLFRDFQLNAFNGINFQVENINSCSTDLNGTDSDIFSNTGRCTGKLKSGVRSIGMEFEMFTRPFRDVSFNLGAVYAATEYRRNLVGAGGRELSPNFFQLPGRTLSNSAEFTATASLSWMPEIASNGTKALFYVDGRHMSTFNTGSDLDIEKTQRSFNVVNGRVGIHGPNGMWALEVWGQNLFNKTYTQVGFDAPLQGTGTGVYSNTARGVQEGRYARANQLFGLFLAEPRTYGLTLRAKFAATPRSAPDYVAPPAPPAPPATQTCADGSVIEVTASCPVIAPPPPPPVPAPSKGERG